MVPIDLESFKNNWALFEKESREGRLPKLYLPFNLKLDGAICREKYDLMPCLYVSQSGIILLISLSSNSLILPKIIGDIFALFVFTPFLLCQKGEVYS